MKKFILRFTSFAILAIACISMAACSLFSDAESIKFKVYPATTYNLTEEGVAADIDFVIVYNSGTSEVELDYQTYQSEIKVINFVTSTVGSRTATVSYKGLTATFQYSVINPASDAGFASGSGVATDPYVIKNMAQFMKISSYSSKYFKLGADIDMSSFEFTSSKTYVISSFTGELDGNGYRIYNLDCSKHTCLGRLFNSLNSATLKNLTVHANGLFSIAYNVYYDTTFENVDRTGTFITESSDNNVGGFAIYCYSTYTYPLRFINCDSYVKMSGVVQYASAFLGYIPGTKTSQVVYFENCNNYGDIIVDGAGIFIANGTDGCGGTGVSIKNCNNYGEVKGIRAAGIYGINAPDTSILTESEKTRRALVIENYNPSATTTVNGKTYVGSTTIVQSTGITRAVNEDKTISFSIANTNVSKVIITAFYYATTYLSETLTNGTLLYGTQEEILSSETKDAKLVFTTTNIKDIRVVNLSAAGTTDKTTSNDIWEAVDSDGELVYIHDTTPNANGEWYAVNGSPKLNIVILAYDANGNLIAGKCTW